MKLMPRRLLRVGILSLFLVINGVVYQNCGNVALTKKASLQQPSQVYEESPKPSFVKPPERFDGVIRLVVLLDVSRSMAEAPCPDGIDFKIDGVSDTQICRAANGESGVDTSFYRLDVVREWLSDIEEELQRRPSLNYKVLIVPFTGGSSQDKWANQTPYRRNTPDFGRKLEEWTKWGDIANSREYLTRIQNLQAAVMERNQLPSPPPPLPHILPELFMGTSIPYPRMQRVQSEIAAEIQRLRQQNLAEKTHFEVVYISDGVPKPHKEHVKNIAGFVWRNKVCKRTSFPNSTGAYCQTIDYERNPYNCINACAADILKLAEQGTYPNPPTCNVQCMDALQDYVYAGHHYTDPKFDVFVEMGKEWGDFTLNAQTKIMSGISQIKGTFFQNPEVRFRFTFAQVNPDEIRAEEKAESINWLEKAKTVYPESRHVVINSPHAPVPVIVNHSGTVAYRLSEFFVYNIQARPGISSTLLSDTDGDGLFDNEESEANKTKPRSEGYCLDIIKARFGCATNLCNKNLDLDGDGLNDCDEKSAGTSPYDFDTDGDGLPDSLEVAYRTDPLRSDRLEDQDSDGKTNFEGLLKGLMPMISMHNVPGHSLVEFTKTFDSFKKLEIPNEGVILIPGYVIDVDNVPIFQTGASQDNVELYTSQQMSAASRVKYRIIGGTRGASKNRIQFLGKVENVTNPGDRYWIYLERDVDYQQGRFSVPLNLEEFEVLKVRDP